MIDITQKPNMYRTSTAEGSIILKKQTIRAIKERNIAKGDVIETSKIAAIMAVKNTPQIIPLTHNIPITGVKVEHEIGDTYIRVRVTVKTTYKTGVEMEALAGVTAALLTIWDMVKSLEKDEKGQYPTTRIDNIRVLEKLKESEGETS